MARMWKGFVTFGSATAGIFGIFVIIRIDKIIIDTAIHGYALHTAYGCSMHLLGAVWSSITHLLLHLAQPKRRRENAEGPPPNPPPNQPMREPTIESPRPAIIKSFIRPSSLSPDIERTTIKLTAQVTINTTNYETLTKRLADLEQIPLKTS
ncbi:uncharacterized protein LOC120358715 [Solenopsis invicta]|uniref:uncharacterized protein LOC120358715 n=1 Tax=Solenopsis invicta TaxID=13686 RepID=UPI00193D14B4|nr:uncharacterized protein LOC120358715 [Solenopsis invicta]